MDSHRQLAAIMFTDIVGYTKIMQHDEQKAISVVKHHEDILEKYVHKHHGKVLNYYGDGSLCVFNSAVEVVECAMELQRKYQQPPKVPLRIGIHIGEILFEDGKVFGDGVNIASRIESLGKEGTVLFSKNVREKIQNLPRFESTSLGEFHFKNVDHPMEVFALSNDGFPVPQPEEIEGKLKHKTETRSRTKSKKLTLMFLLPILAVLAFIFYNNISKEKVEMDKGRGSSIVVLPFRNLSGDANKEYFADGITSEIITELANIKNLTLISEISALAFKGSDKNAKQIAAELGVDFIVEGIVNVVGDKINLKAQLIEAKNDSPIWTNRYNKLFNPSDLFDVQIDLAKKIASGINIKLTNEEQESIEHLGTRNFEAYDLFLKAKAANRNFSFFESIDFLEKALNIDSEFSHAYSLLAWNYMFLSLPEWYTVGMPLSEVRKIANPAIEKAISLNPKYSDTYLVKGAIDVFVNWDYKSAEENFNKAMKLASWPDMPTNYCFCAYIHYLFSNMRLDEAMDIAQKSKKIDPANFFDNTHIGLIYYLSGKPRLAIETWEKVTDYIQIPIIYLFMGSFNYHIGEMDEALRNFQLAETLYQRQPYKLKAYYANVYYKIGREQESKAILNELYSLKNNGGKYIAYSLAMIESEMGNYNQALDLLEEAYREEDASFAFVTVDFEFKHLENHERYKKILRKIGYQHIQ